MGGKHPCGERSGENDAVGTREDSINLAREGSCLRVMQSAVVSLPFLLHLAHLLPFVGSCCQVKEAIPV